MVDKQQTAAPTTDSKHNPALDHIKSMPPTPITETLITVLPGLSSALLSEAQISAKVLSLEDRRFVMCILDLELFGGFNKALEFTHDDELASIYIDAIVFNLTAEDPSRVPSEMDFRLGGTENFRGIAKYAKAKDYFNVSFPEAWMFGKEYSQIKTGNALDFAYVASVSPVVVTIIEKGALLFQHMLSVEGGR
jgi:hypothetical protein